MSEVERIAREATAFRRAFESADLSDAPGFLPHFPEGCCSWATWFLGHYLATERGYRASSVAGHRMGAESSDSHQWLLVNGVVVDITADQFFDSPATVIVERESTWHSTWETTAPEDLPTPEQWDRVGSNTLPSTVYKRLAQLARAAA